MTIDQPSKHFASTTKPIKNHDQIKYTYGGWLMTGEDQNDSDPFYLYKIYTVFKGSRFFLWQNLPILNKANQKGLYLYTIWFRQVSTYYISVFLSNRIIYKKINLYNINYWFYTWKEILAEKSVFYFPSIDPSTFFL